MIDLCTNCFRERRKLTEPEYPACKALEHYKPGATDCEECNGEMAMYRVVFFMNGIWQ